MRSISRHWLQISNSTKVPVDATTQDVAVWRILDLACIAWSCLPQRVGMPSFWHSTHKTAVMLTWHKTQHGQTSAYIQAGTRTIRMILSMSVSISVNNKTYPWINQGTPYSRLKTVKKVRKKKRMIMTHTIPYHTWMYQTLRSQTGLPTNQSIRQ